MAILEEVLAPDERLTPRQLLQHVRRLGLRTPAESTAIIRADRDAR
jgi:hypothetical protein